MPRRTVIEDSSDEETNDANIPSDESLEQGLRDAVANIFRTGNLENLTVKRVRLATESALGLEEGFFKCHDTWKARSDRMIKEEAEAQEEHKSQRQDKAARESPAPAPSSKTSNRKANKSAKRDLEEAMPNKKKRRKVASDIESEEIISPSEEEEKSTITSPKPISKVTAVQKQASDESENEKPQKPLDEESVADKGEQSESEMSVVLDEEPKPKPKKRQKGAQTAPKAPKAPKAKSASKASGIVDPEQAEIKRLQGWLIKCGIRKMWHRELADYETPKAKIKHLKKMLEDAGMKGRYSIEKARQIREERELQADLEAVKEGASKWGAGGAVDGSDSEQEKPRRRLVKGRQSLAFLSDDGEETD